MIYIGIDVDKHYLKAALPVADGKFRNNTVTNNEAGVDQLLEWCQLQVSAGAGRLAFVLEATGVYHESAALLLYDRGRVVHVVNPARPKHFKQSRGITTKTDEVDAKILSLFGLHTDLRQFEPESLAIRELKQTLSRLEAVEKDIRRESNRTEKAQAQRASTTVLESLEESLDFLNRQAEKLRKKIDDHIDQNPTLKHDKQLLESIPGIAQNTARRLLSVMRSRDFDNAKATAAFIGLAVRHHQSGKQKGRSTITKAGSAKLRAQLYFPAIVATKHNPIIREHYQRLLAAGKPKMVALVAAMRKLLHIAFGVLKNQQPFNPNQLLQQGL